MATKQSDAADGTVTALADALLVELAERLAGKIRFGELPLLLTKDEAAEQLSLSTPAVERLIRDGRLRSCKINGARRVPRAALGELIEAHVDTTKQQALEGTTPAGVGAPARA